MLNVSVVLYHPSLLQLYNLLDILQQSECVKYIYLIDNSPERTIRIPDRYKRTKYIFNGKNLGYGAGHNIALRKTIAHNIPYHLVVNSDISFSPDILLQMLYYMDQHPDVGQMMPKVLYPNGQIQYLCKLLPTPLDLFGRRFLPRKLMQRRNYKFELRASGYNHIINAPYLSGCFMLLRTATLERIGLFDERFFMYPEDIDLTRRIHREYHTLFYPEATIIHDHAQASYRNLRMLWIHIVNLCRYFNKWGWFIDSERRQTNHLTMLAIDK
ncbi:MAG: glycosyltransferase [Paludibacter sp.]|nr:glycosyltransferase [Bacteroidales bacterium]MCM1068585.1 glycosyltransferase [Prevotella sp.]MCM1353249.1 glycosyltransferase [Bacteroides sp.]MCM1442343.1 glycosyltransferase [Muribaculum sp.]MCM1481162.1 glycosyltransferase [Paludibacter sp.]